MTQPWELSAIQALTAFREKSLAPTELLASVQQRVQALDATGSKPISAITQQLSDTASAAKRADQYYTAGYLEPFGQGPNSLVGLPVVAKEKHFLAGHTLSEGLEARAENISSATHPIVPESSRQVGSSQLGPRRLSFPARQ